MALPLSYHWRHLFVRKTTTLLTTLVIAAVVAVFTWMVGFDGALRDSLATAHDDQKVLVMRRGATAETNSAIPIEDFNKLNQLNGLARDAANEPLLSPEMMAQTSRPRIRDGGKTWGNVAVRGVTEIAFKVHTNVKLTGAMFKPGAREVIVGQNAAKQFAGLNVGNRLMLGYGSDRDYVVVGHFSADGGPAESEIWGYLPSLMNAWKRTTYSSTALRVNPSVGADAVIEQIRGPAIQLEAQTEGAYWREQTRTILLYLRVTRVLILAMAVAAVFSIANTMFAMVAGRTREIAMLRTIGYGRRQILLGFVVESLLLSLLGGLMGCLACAAWLGGVGNTKDMFGASTFTTLAFEIKLSPLSLAAALACVVAVGILGALFPARRAAAIPVVAALREE